MRTRRSFHRSVLVLVALSCMVAENAHAGAGWFHRKRAEIKWTYSLDEGLARAKRENRPVMIDFMAVWCPPCRAMEDSTFSNPDVARRASAFVPVRIDIDKQREVAAKYNALARKYGGIGIPNVLFLGADGKTLKHIVGYYGPEQFIAAMDSALAPPR